MAAKRAQLADGRHHSRWRGGRCRYRLNRRRCARHVGIRRYCGGCCNPCCSRRCEYPVRRGVFSWRIARRHLPAYSRSRRCVLAIQQCGLSRASQNHVGERSQRCTRLSRYRPPAGACYRCNRRRGDGALRLRSSWHSRRRGRNGNSRAARGGRPRRQGSGLRGYRGGRTAGSSQLRFPPLRHQPIADRGRTAVGRRRRDNGRRYGSRPQCRYGSCESRTPGHYVRCSGAADCYRRHRLY